MVVSQPGITPRQLSVLSGAIPPLADSYGPRPETGPDLGADLHPGEVVALTQGERSVAAPAGQGGTGTTQLAAEFAHAVRDSRAVDLLAWVTATSRDAVIAGFAQAADAIGIDGPDDDAETAATRFVTWLAHTERPWVLVLDDLTAAADLENVWPSGQAGRVVITTRLPGPTLSRTAVSRNRQGLRIIPIGGFSGREGLLYLSGRLTADQQPEAVDLCDDLDGLPLCLAQAAAEMSLTGLGCREYRARLAERRRHVPVVPGVSAAVLATMSLAAECADGQPPIGLAWPVLTLAAILDGHGIPETVLTSTTACGYIVGRPGTGSDADRNMARAAIATLAAVGLLSIDPASPAGMVRMHPSVQAAVRAFLAPADLEMAVLAAADALVEAWPTAGGRTAPLEQALRDCGTALSEVADAVLPTIAPDPGPGPARPANPLWHTEAHPLLFCQGLSLNDSMLTDSAVAYWQRLAATSTWVFGTAHASTVAARDGLAGAYEAAGHFAEAIAMFQDVLAARERSRGPDDTDTIAVRRRLAHAHISVGEPVAAIALYQQVAADSSRLLGPADPATLAVRASLADACQRAGRGPEAVATYASRLTDADRTLGSDHPVTVAVRADLAEAYLANGQAKDGIAQCRQVLAVREAKRGRNHPDTIAARTALASALRRGGKANEAIAQYQQVLADRELAVGTDHPDTISARANLAFGYRSGGQLREAIPVYEQALADRQRVSGIDHADTRITRANLASAYLQAGRLSDAIAQYERALADCERILGPGELETLSVRVGLAAAQHADGRLVEAAALLKRTLADCERYLGRDHPMTRSVRANLAAVSDA